MSGCRLRERKRVRETEREIYAGIKLPFLSLSPSLFLSVAAYPGGEGPRGADDGNKAQASGYLWNQVSKGTLTALIWFAGIPSEPNDSNYSDITGIIQMTTDTGKLWVSSKLAVILDA